MSPRAKSTSAANLPVWRMLAVMCWLALAAGCMSFGERRTPAFTSVATAPVHLPARIISNFLLIEAQQADGKTYRFMIDTGSSATLVSPAVASALGKKPRKDAPPHILHVRSADGRDVELPAVTLRLLVLGGARFEQVPAGINDFSDLSNHLGVQIDGILGFPLFRDTILTLDYPAVQIGIAPNPLLGASPPKPSPRTSTLTFDNETATPLVPVQMGTESFVVLIDTGSDAGLTMNPAGLHPRFASGPRTGTLVTTLGGDRRQLVGRLAQNVSIGTQLVQQPVVDLTEQLSSLGGELLRHFTLTFDQRRNLVTLVRDSDGPVQIPARRTTGLAFRRFPAYWRVLALVPDTPGSALPVQTGDLCVRVNGEPVSQWDYERYATLLRTATKITYTFLTGPKEQDFDVSVEDLVP